MNERMRELYRQASDQAYVNACVKNKTDRPQNNTIWNEFPEVFAELIVRECAVPMITLARELDADGRYKDHPAEVIAATLYQELVNYFGVRE